MPTRFYLPRTGGAGAFPSYDAAWDDTASAVRRACVTTKVGTAVLALTGGNGTVGAANVLIVQYVSAPIGAQAISGTIKGQVGCGEYDAAVNACSQLVVRVVSGDGSTVRGTLVSAHAAALSSEWGLDIAPKNRKFPLAALSPLALSSVNAQDGDRLVFEIGAKVENNDAEQIELIVGDGVGSDMPEDETTTAGLADPWIELSGTISFAGAAAPLAAGHSGGIRVSLGL